MSENDDDYLAPWASDMLRVGAVDNRGRPSDRALARIAGASNATVSRMLRGVTEPQAATVEKVAAALEISPSEAWKRLGQIREQTDAYTPPDESAFLTQRERKLVTEMIRVLVEGRHDRTADHPQSDRQNDALARDAVEDGPTSARLSVVSGKLPSSEREELYRRAEQVDMDAEPYAAAGPEDTSDDDESV